MRVGVPALKPNPSRRAFFSEDQAAWEDSLFYQRVRDGVLADLCRQAAGRALEVLLYGETYAGTTQLTGIQNVGRRR